MRKFYALFLLAYLSFPAKGQNVAINNDGSLPHASAILDIKSSSKGLLIPRMTTAFRNAITSPAKGLIVMDTTVNSLYYYNGTTWGELSSVNSNLWNKTGNDIYNTNSANIGIGTSVPNSTALLHVNTGSSTTKGLLVTGTHNTSATVPDLGASTRMMFYPGKAAFRAGRVTGTQWDNNNVGFFSIATGHNTIASGEYSIAMGGFTTASGSSSTAMGYYPTASGVSSTAMGYGTTASGGSSTAMGNSTTAGGFASTAMGSNTTASGSYATTMGLENLAKGYSTTVVGVYNDSLLTTNQTSVTATTPLFIVGNGDGTGVGQRSNAMVIQKNGNVGIGNSTPNDAALLHVNTLSSTTKGLLVTGTYDAAATVPNLGAGSRMMFYPGKAAFRVGSVSGTQWDDINAGDFSMAMGANTTASGFVSTAMGINNVASGSYSTAMGRDNVASRYASTAMGYNTIASGQYSTVMGNNTIASEENSTAMGYNTTASGHASTAMGYNAIASGSYSTAMGYNAIASGSSSTAMGNNTIASGSYSSAMGIFNFAKGFSSTVVGMYNDSLLTSNQTSVTTTTPLFIVGNGDGSAVGQRSNAMVVRKNGDVETENLIIGEGTKISKQQAGQAIPGSNPGSGFMTYTLTFPTAFAGTPKIVATAKNDPAWNVDDSFLVSVRTISATQVIFNILRVDVNSGWNQSLRVDWMAWE